MKTIPMSHRPSRVPANSYPKPKTNMADTANTTEGVTGTASTGRMISRPENKMVSANASMKDRRYPRAG